MPSLGSSRRIPRSRCPRSTDRLAARGQPSVLKVQATVIGQGPPLGPLRLRMPRSQRFVIGSDLMFGSRKRGGFQQIVPEPEKFFCDLFYFFFEISSQISQSVHKRGGIAFSEQGRRVGDYPIAPSRGEHPAPSGHASTLLSARSYAFHSRQCCCRFEFTNQALRNTATKTRAKR